MHSQGGLISHLLAARLTGPWQAQIDLEIHLIVRDLPRIRDPRSIVAVLALLRIIRNLKPDILHLQDSVNPWFDLVAASHDLPPMVVTVHDATRHPGESRGEWFTGPSREAAPSAGAGGDRSCFDSARSPLLEMGNSA